MRNQANGCQMFRLMRFYSIASFISIFIAAALLTLFYRHVTVQGIVRLAERSNLALAQTTLNSVRPALIEYLDSVAGLREREIAEHKLSSELARAVAGLMEGTSIVRVKIYNRNGVVAFSSKPGQIGKDQGDNPGFQSAFNGAVISSMIYRDTFNRFDKTTEEDNLMQTYVPVRKSPTDPIHGVFELYADVSPLVKENERIMLVILAGAEFILAALYFVLILVVRRARNVIEAQQQTIRERTATLEILSSRLIKSEELEKKKIANDLHEGLAQTLSAIKANVESSRQLIAGDDEKTRSLDSIVPVLQSAIQEVRAIATDLRPSSLDDLGLIPTIGWFCREFERLHPAIRVVREISLTEDKIPVPLKIVIYRVMESVFENIALHSYTDRIVLALLAEEEENAISVEICDSPSDPTARLDPTPDPHLRFAEAQERTLLSGGVFSARRDRTGRVQVNATWPTA